MPNVVTTENLSEALNIQGGCYEVDGKCSRCGGCCTRFLPITRSEEKDIRRYIRKKHVPLEHHGDADVDMLCPFLHFSEGEQTSCSIYPVRPKVCRLWSCRGWMYKQKSFINSVGRRLCDRPGLVDDYDMWGILGEAPHADAARMIMELRKRQEIYGVDMVK